MHYSRKNQTEVLDADPADIVDTLRLKFEDQFRLIGVDAAARDLLVLAVTTMHRKRRRWCSL
jgi:hypothetical protein